MPRLPEELRDDAETVVGIGTGDVLLDQYEVGPRLGRGGMGEVFRGRDLHLDRPVAIKVLPAFLGTSARAREGLRDEAKRAIALAHPGLARIHHFGIHDDQPFLVMELVEGETLAARLEREGRLALDAALEVLGPVAAALDHAHEARVVHRDLKPANILLRADTGAPVLIDFGIAAEVRDHTTRSGYAPVGDTAGTLAYMSPEQIRGDPPHPSMDRYALAAVAYELLAGDPPFFRGDPMNVQYQIVHEAPKPIAGIPGAVDAVVARGLAKNASQRFGSAAALVEALRAPGDAPPPAPPEAEDTAPLPGRDLLPGDPGEVTAPRPVAAPDPDPDPGGMVEVYPGLPGVPDQVARGKAFAFAALGMADGIVSTGVATFLWNVVVVEAFLFAKEGGLAGRILPGSTSLELDLIRIAFHALPLIFLYAPAFAMASAFFANILEERAPGLRTPLLAGIAAGVFPGALAISYLIPPLKEIPYIPGPGRVALVTAGFLATGAVTLTLALFLPRPPEGRRPVMWLHARWAMVLIFPTYSAVAALVIAEQLNGTCDLTNAVKGLVGSYGLLAWFAPPLLIAAPAIALGTRLSAAALEARYMGAGAPVVLGGALSLAVHGVVTWMFPLVHLPRAYSPAATATSLLGTAMVLAAGRDILRAHRAREDPPGIE